MKSVLDSAHTWFFEGVVHGYPDTLEVQLVEGIKSEESELVEVVEGRCIGPFFRIRVLPSSRCVTVRFSRVVACQIVNESYRAPQTDISSDDGVLRKCSDLAYLRYLQSDSLVEQLQEGAYSAYFVWSEDQAIFVVCLGDVEAILESRLPDLSIERHQTYTAR